MKISLNELDETLVELVQQMKLMLGGDPENIIFCAGENEGIAFDFEGTVKEIQNYAEKNELFLICLQPYEIAKKDDEIANWIAGGIAVTQSKVKFYFTDQIGHGNEFSFVDVKMNDVIILFAIQIVQEVDYILELKKEEDESFVGFCVYPEKKKFNSKLRIDFNPN